MEDIEVTFEPPFGLSHFDQTSGTTDYWTREVGKIARRSEGGTITPSLMVRTLGSVGTKRAG
eukprot:5980679-Lingulodinium_polyedra.AAC.1